MSEITVVGGGVAGLVAAISCAEAGERVVLIEASRELGGRARTLDGDFRANFGPHVIYSDGASWAWLRERGLTPSSKGSPLNGVRFVYDGRSRQRPPLSLVRAVLRLRHEAAPIDV